MWLIKMNFQMKRIIAWKVENRTISAQVKVLKSKIESGNFDMSDINKLESLSIKKGRNISRLYRIRTKISQEKSSFDQAETGMIKCVTKHFLNNSGFDSTNFDSYTPMQIQFTDDKND